jgi:hypothetical protein
MSLTEKQKKLFSGHKWGHAVCLDGDFGGFISNHCESLGISKTIHTPRAKGQEENKTGLNHYDKPIITYYLNNDKREFKSLEELAQALEEKTKVKK